MGRGGIGFECGGRTQAPKAGAEKVAKAWAEEWAKEGTEEVDWQKLMPLRGFRVLPLRWVVERTFAWISHNRRIAKDYERLIAVLRSQDKAEKVAVIHREHGDKNAELLARLEERYRRELMGEEQRLELRDRIRRLKSKVETAAEPVDAQHSGLERMRS